MKRRALMAAACAYAAYTAWLIVRMFWFLYYSMTSAIRVDELTMMEEIRLYREGKYGIGYLWGSYWGHRLLIPRLLMIADQRFFHFSNTPLVAVTVVAQILTTAVLAWVMWRMLKDTPRWLAIVVVTAMVHLAFNALQLETFAYGMEVQYTLGFLGACSAIVLFALERNAFACLACALLCALSIGTGVFIGPVLLLVAVGLRRETRVPAGLALLSTGYGAVYSIGYVNPGECIGFVGALLHPLGAIWATALVLGGPITDAHLAWGGACGGAGMLMVGGAVVLLLRGRLSREAAALTGFCLFMVLNAVGIALTRYTLEGIAALGSNTMLPSRYFTVAFLFWGPLLALFAGMRGGILFSGSCVAASAIVGYLTLHPLPSQLDVSVAWLEFHRKLDVAGAGMIMGATDPEFLFRLTPDQNALDHFRPYMRQNRLSYFADDRASWPGRDVKSVFGEPVGGCRGSIDQRSPAGTATVRLQGFVDGSGVTFPHEREIVLTDSAGKIDGLGNTLAASEKRGGEDFVAYAEAASAAAFVITPDHKACRFTP